MKRIPLILMLCALFQATVGQDQQYTQFYAVPSAMNPAFAGAAVQSRLSIQYRNQWAAIPGGFQSGNLAYDRYLPQLKSGMGLLVSHDRAGSGALRSTAVNFQYAYEARIRRNWFFRPALQFGYVTKNIDFTKLTFYDQMIRDNSTSSLEQGVFQPISYFDMGAGMITYGPKFWLGASAYHLNTPNESLYGMSDTSVPMRVAVQGGLRLRIKGNSLTRLDHHIVFAANYQAQKEFDQLDLGFYYEFSPVIIGAWYRGLPAKSNSYGVPNHDAIAILLGVQASKYKIGYSYDITVSTLGIGSSAGSHELTLSYQWSNKKNLSSMKKRIVPCAKF
ncbi:MAG: PorP/SprF family type IX secretion system membrane protein [Crocinitomicaceae bacterium]|nr:PorP/SprF family type IX secretion system membrane protein [Crocinitomicaceae bacterium]